MSDLGNRGWPNSMKLGEDIDLGELLLQPWPELLGHKGNKPVKMTYFLPPPPPDAMLMSGIQVIFKSFSVDSTLLGGRGDKRNGLVKQH